MKFVYFFCWIGFSIFLQSLALEKPNFERLSPDLPLRVACHWDFSAEDTAFIQQKTKQIVLDFDSLFNNTYLSGNSEQVKARYLAALMALFENPDSAYFTAEWNERTKVSAGAYLPIEYRQYCQRNQLFLEAEKADFQGFFIEDSMLKVSVSFVLKYQKNTQKSADTLAPLHVSEKEAVFRIAKKNKKIVLFLERVVKLNRGNLRYERKLFFPKVRHLEVESLFKSKPHTYKRNDTLKFVWRDNLCQKPVAVELWRLSDTDTTGRYSSFSMSLYEKLDTNRVSIILTERVADGRYCFLVRSLENPTITAKSNIFYVKNDTVVNICAYQELSQVEVKSLESANVRIRNGEKVRISWQASLVSNVKIRLYKGKKQVLNISDYNRSNNLYFDWQVGKTLPKGTYFVRVESLECPKIVAESAPFEISKPKPNRNE